jgi:hypothetical protein
MVSYDRPELLEDHGDRFVCILFFLAEGVRGWHLNADKVFDELEMEGFKDQPQARVDVSWLWDPVSSLLDDMLEFPTEHLDV